MRTPARLIRLCLLTMSVLGLLGRAGTANAGTVFLSGDGTPFFSLTDSSPDFASAGNQQFFTNVLAGGTEVLVLSSFRTVSEREADEFFEGLVGVTSRQANGELSEAILAGIDLLLISAPDNTFTLSEIAAVGGFLDAGGTLFISGEAFSIFPGPNAIVNDILFALGIGLSLNANSIDIGNHVATGIQIASDPFVSGVSAYSYGATSTVTGGTPLLFTAGGDPFVSYVVPEPSTALLLSIGLVGLGVRQKRVA